MVNWSTCYASPSFSGGKGQTCNWLVVDGLLWISGWFSGIGRDNSSH